MTACLAARRAASGLISAASAAADEISAHNIVPVSRRISAKSLTGPFARLDWISRDRFDLQWHRHTGEWFCLHRNLALADAIDTLRSEGLFHPF